MLSPLTEPHADVRRHAVVLILPTLDRLQAGPVGGGIRAGKADERVGCKRKAKLILGAGGKMSSLGGRHLCPTGMSRICPQPHFLFQFYQPEIGDSTQPQKKKKKLGKRRVQASGRYFKLLSAKSDTITAWHLLSPLFAPRMCPSYSCQLETKLQR